MTPSVTIFLQSLPLLFLVVPVMQQVCVEVDSETDAVINYPMKLRCISCKIRAEMETETKVNWYYIDKNNTFSHIFEYPNEKLKLVEPWKGRLQWNGTTDLQDLSIIIHNVSLNDTGTYRCNVTRRMGAMPPVFIIKDIKLVVREKALPNMTAFYSEIMMYFLLTLMSLSLLVALVNCFRKIARADARAQDSSNDIQTIPSENEEDLASTIED